MVGLAGRLGAAGQEVLPLKGAAVGPTTRDLVPGMWMGGLADWLGAAGQDVLLLK